MTSRPWNRPLAALGCAIVLVGVAALSACSAPAANTAPATKITLAFSAWPGWFPWQVAQEQGLFAANSVDVELKYFDNYTDSLNALATGDVDANSQTLNDTLVSVSGGAKQTIVLVNDNSTGNDQIIAGTGIASVADLKGKTSRRRAGHGRPLPAAAGAAEGRADRKDVTDQAAADRRRGGRVQGRAGRRRRRVRAVHHDRPGASGQQGDRHLEGLPRRDPGPPGRSTAAFVAEHPDRGPGGGQDLVRHASSGSPATRTTRIEIMAKRGRGERRGLPDLRRRYHDLHPGAEPCRVHPGTTPANLELPGRPDRRVPGEHRAGRDKPSLDGLLEPKFVKAVARSEPLTVRGAASVDTARRRLPRGVRGGRRCRGAGRPGGAAAARHPDPDPRRAGVGAGGAVLAVPLAGLVVAERQRSGDRRTFLPAAGAAFRPAWRWCGRASCSTDVSATVQRVLLGLRPRGARFRAARRRRWAASGPARPCSSRSSGCCATCRPRAFIPLLIIWLGLGEPPKIALIFLGTVFFNTLMTADVVRGVPMRAHRRLVHARRPDRRGAPQGDHPALAARHDRRRPGQRRRRLELRRGGRADRVRVRAGLPDRPRAPGSGRSTGSSRCSSSSALIGLAIDIALRVLRDRVGRWVREHPARSNWRTSAKDYRAGSARALRRHRPARPAWASSCASWARAAPASRPCCR